MDIGNQINLVVDNLAGKLGIAVEKVYPMMIRQAYVDVVSMSIALVLTCVFAGFGVKKLSNTYKKKCASDDDKLFWWIIASVGIFIACICIVVFVVNVPTALLNPEYYALQKILGLVNKN